jgi:hypothetical protein
MEPDITDQAQALVDDLGEGWVFSRHWSNEWPLRRAQAKRDLLARLTQLELRAHAIKTLLFHEDFRRVTPANFGQ